MIEMAFLFLIVSPFVDLFNYLRVYLANLCFLKGLLIAYSINGGNI
jgi:hypothetical protein